MGFFDLFLRRRSIVDIHKKLDKIRELMEQEAIDPEELARLVAVHISESVPVQENKELREINRKLDMLINEISSEEDIAKLIAQNIMREIDPTHFDESRMSRLKIHDSIESLRNELLSIKTSVQKIDRKLPPNVVEIIESVKTDIMSRLDSLVESNRSVESPAVIPSRGIKDIVKSLSPKQKKVFALLMQSGFLSYKEIAFHLGINHNSAKNLVNRIFQDAEKSKLFVKQETPSGEVKVGVSEEVSEEILRSKYRNHTK